MSDPAETSLAPWVIVGDASRAVVFYSEALGAEEMYRLEEDGALAVARLRIGASQLWVQTEPGMGPRAERSVRMILTVADPDAAFERAVDAGATPVAGVHDEYGWRTGRVTDPFGYDWEFSKQLDDV
jgi:PhnB protein